MKIGSLCTGYGGLDLAVETAFNAETVWYSEFDKYASKVMEHHRPYLTNHGDLTQIDWHTVEPVDIITAGYPCQPFSQAGKRKGTNDDRHIWPHIAKAISTIRPSIVVLENVRGHLNLGFDQVLATLTSIGYDARWDIVRASDIGAPHRRERLFIIAQPANSDSIGRHRVGHNGSSRYQGQSQSVIEHLGSALTNTNGDAYGQPQRAIGTVRGETGEVINGSDWQVNWGRYQDAVTRWEQLTRSAPQPVKNDCLEPKFVEWMMGLPDGWVTDLDLSQSQQLKILGNGVVPQQALFAIAHLLNR